MCRDDMNHDFVTGVFNRRYYETEFCTKLDEWTDCHRCAALALVSIDGAEKLSARESDASWASWSALWQTSGKSTLTSLLSGWSAA
mgnify:FL=1